MNTNNIINNKPSGFKDNIKKIIIVIFAIAVITGCLLFINENAFTNQDKLEDIEIGAILPLTGAAASSGSINKNTIRMLVDMWNEKGGIAGRKIQVVFFDSMGDSKNGAMLANRIVLDKPDIVFISFSGVCLSAQPIFEKNKVIQLCGAATDALFASHPKYTIRNYFSPKDLCSYFLSNIDNYFQKNEFSIIYENTDLGLSYKDALIDNAKKNNVKVNKIVEISINESDFRNIIMKSKFDNNDLIYIAARLQPLGRVIKQLRDSGFKGKIISDAAINGDEPKSIYGSNNNNLFSLTFKENNKNIRTEYFRRYELNIDEISLVIFNGLNTLFEFMDKNRIFDSDEIMGKINNFNSSSFLDGTKIINNEILINLEINRVEGN